MQANSPPRPDGGSTAGANALAASSAETAEGLYRIAAGLRSSSPVLRLPPRGRPSRAQLADSSAVRAAPFPELVLAPADRLCCYIRTLRGTRTLRAAYAFELAHDRRKSVLDELEARLRSLGEPLGGPRAEPLARYQGLSSPEVIARLQAEQRRRSGEQSAALAAHVYAWEFNRRRRSSVLEAAAQIASLERCRALVERTRAPRPPCPPEPFAGYDALSTASSPSARQRVRAKLGAQPPDVLERCLHYERLTKRRAGMLCVLERALRRRSQVPQAD